MRSAQSASGTGVSISATLAEISCAFSAPSSTETTAGCREAKRKARLADGNAMGAANGFDLLDTLEDLGRSVGIIIFGSGNGARREDPRVEDAGDDDADLLLHRQRQEALQRRLFEQRITPGQQHQRRSRRP